MIHPSVIGILGADSFKTDIRDELQQVDSDPYFLGQAAYIQYNKGLKNCPYNLDTVESMCWMLGWKQAKSEDN